MHWKLRENNWFNKILGFSDRSDSFDLNVAIQDHFKSIKKAHEISNEEENQSKFADLSKYISIFINLGCFRVV